MRLTKTILRLSLKQKLACTICASKLNKIKKVKIDIGVPSNFVGGTSDKLKGWSQSSVPCLSKFSLYS